MAKQNFSLHVDPDQLATVIRLDLEAAKATALLVGQTGLATEIDKIAPTLNNPLALQVLVFILGRIPSSAQEQKQLFTMSPQDANAREEELRQFVMRLSDK